MFGLRSVRDGHFELTVVAYDYFAEFATICGLLSAFGLNIEEGQIYTFSETAVSSPPTKPRTEKVGAGGPSCVPA